MTPQPRRSVLYLLAQWSARDRHVKALHSRMQVTPPAGHAWPGTAAPMVIP